jgi:outer membrane lipoprotein-sorting protein
LVAVLLSANRPLSAMEQVAAAVREVKSYSFKMSTVFGLAKRASETKIYWAAPGSRRMEDFAEGKPTEVEIFPYHQPGTRFNLQQKTYLHMPAQQGAVSPLLLVSKLGGFRGQADRELGEKQIDGRAAQGFEIAVTKVDPGVPAGMLAVWVDAETKLPVLLEAEMPMPGENVKLKFADFQWNTALDEKLFDTTPPAGYADNTPKPPTVEEQTAAIVDALKFYAEVSDGRYPRVKMVYGDVTMHDLEKKIGLEGRPTAEQIKSKNYVRYLRAIQGFGWVNTIQRENADAAYYGKTVGAKDAGAVLLRWKLDDGRCQVIYGDLRAETVSGEQLKKLEVR